MMMLVPPLTESFLGYSVVNGTIEECAQYMFNLINSREQLEYIACLNPHSLEKAEKDKEFKAALQNANILVPDGIGIVLGSKLLGGQVNTRITGSDIFEKFSEQINKKGGGKYFFLGSTPNVLKKIEIRMKIEYPNIEIAGCFSPPYKTHFDDSENHVMIDKINASKADVLWVGMTAPKQEKWIYANKNFLDARVAVAIGAVFDFYAGTVKRSPVLFQQMGLEWLPRLLQEPKRLWERNLISTPKFINRVIRAKINKCLKFF